MTAPFELTFKTPDVFDQIDDDRSLSDDAREDAKAFAARFVKWGEIVTLRFDPAAGTVTAVPAR